MIHRALPVLDTLLTAARNVDVKSGFLRPVDLADLGKAAAGYDALKEPIPAAAAKQLWDRLQFDSKIDDFDKPALLEAARALKAMTPGEAGPTLSALAAALKAAAIPQANLSPRRMDMSLDMSAVQDPNVSQFNAVTRYQLQGKIPSQALLAVNPDRLQITSVKVGGQSVPFEVAHGRLAFETHGQKNVELEHTVKPQFIAGDDDWAAATGLIVDRRNPDDVQTASLTWPYNTD